MKKEMVGSCSTYVEGERCVQGFGGEGDHLEDIGVNGRIILKMDLQEVGWGHALDRSGSE